MSIRPFFLMLICLVAFTQAMAEIYETRDAQGHIIYTDVPPKEGAPKLKLPPVNVFEAPDPFDSPQETPIATAGDFKYEKLEILSPSNDETIFINTTPITIQIKLLPDVNRGEKHRLQILWDDQVLAQNQLSYQLAEADRGDHVIQARVVDKNNKALISATPVTVHVKRPFN